MADNLAERMLDLVASGKTADDAINQIISERTASKKAVKQKKPEAETKKKETMRQVYRCVNQSECDFMVINTGKPVDVCPKCGSLTIINEEEIKGNPDSTNPVVRDAAVTVVTEDGVNPIQQYTLAFLRPSDRFIFLNVIPDMADRGVEYTIVPAKRGWVSFTDNFERTFTIPLCRALIFPVKLLSSEYTDPNKKFILGDKICCVESNREGRVVRIKGNNGYMIRFDDEPEKQVWKPGSRIKLIDRDATTISYITQSNGKNNWTVTYGDFMKECKDFSSALKLLNSRNRPAFNRYSKLLAMNKIIDLDTETVELLIQLDPRIWGKKENLVKHGYIQTNDEFDAVRDRFNLHR